MCAPLINLPFSHLQSLEFQRAAMILDLQLARKKIEEPQIVQRPIGPLQLEVACGKRRCSCVDIHVPVLVGMFKACLKLQPCSIRIKLSFSREL